MGELLVDEAVEVSDRDAQAEDDASGDSEPVDRRNGDHNDDDDDDFMSDPNFR